MFGIVPTSFNSFECTPRLKPVLDLLGGKRAVATLVHRFQGYQYPTPKASQADLLAHLIDARGTSQTEVAREAGVPRSVISNVLKGRRKISQANIVRLARYFHVSAAAFIENHSP